MYMTAKFKYESIFSELGQTKKYYTNYRNCFLTYNFIIWHIKLLNIIEYSFCFFVFFLFCILEGLTH